MRSFISIFPISVFLAVVAFIITLFLVQTVLGSFTSTLISSVNTTNLTPQQASQIATMFSQFNSVLVVLIPVLLAGGTVLLGMQLIGGYDNEGYGGGNGTQKGQVNLGLYNGEQEQVEFEKEILDMHEYFKRDA